MLFVLIYGAFFLFILKKESARAKTKEELLAEERDYKRRRTSYRGKKVNRNPTEVHAKVLFSVSCSVHIVQTITILECFA